MTGSTNKMVFEWVGNYRAHWLVEDRNGDISLSHHAYNIEGQKAVLLPLAWHLRDPIDLW